MESAKHLHYMGSCNVCVVCTMTINVTCSLCQNQEMFFRQKCYISDISCVHFYKTTKLL